MLKSIVLFCVLFLVGTTVFAQDKELPAISQKNKDSFFIPAVVCKKYNLEAANGDAWMKVYNNLAGDAAVQRMNDIRWQALSKKEALTWYAGNLQLLSESGEDITAKTKKPAGTDAWNVYEANTRMKQMMEAMGIKQKQYTFTFTVDKYIAKIFVGLRDDQTLADVLKIADEGVKAMIRGAAGK